MTGNPGIPCCPQCFLSIIIPTYNRKGLVADAIDSALLFGKGIDGGFEVIVVDDGSTDGTMNMLRERYAAQRDTGTVKLVCTPQNLGVTGAKNAGADQAAGRWFLFLDSDDLLIPEAAQEVAALLNQPSACPLMIFRCEHLETGKLIGPPVNEAHALTLRDLLNKGTPGECLPVVRSDAFARSPYDPQLRGCEGWTYARMIQALGPARIEPRVVRRYRTANPDRLCSITGRIERSCQIAEYYRRILRYYFRVLTSITALRMLLKWVAFRCLCMILEVYRTRTSTPTSTGRERGGTG